MGSEKSCIPSRVIRSHPNRVVVDQQLALLFIKTSSEEAKRVEYSTEYYMYDCFARGGSRVRASCTVPRLQVCALALHIITQLRHHRIIMEHVGSGIRGSHLRPTESRSL